MSDSIKILEPKALWNHFADINAVPRPSKKEERIIQYMLDFGNALGLETYRDEIGNVIIKKPATPGMEKKQTVALQSHLDMVHQKNNDTVFDFENEGIRMFVDGDWVKAEGTTLGADNGIGVATIMALLSSNDIPHPPLEALFTIDEETGMTGALELKAGHLTAPILLNLDTEDDDELTIGCAGGIDISMNGEYEQINAPDNHLTLEVHVKGCTGGHSGMDIHKGRANANKLMNRLLYTLSLELDILLVSIDGGGLRNAIPRESVAHIMCNASEKERIEEIIMQLETVLQAEHKSTDPGLKLSLKTAENSAKAASSSFNQSFLNAIYSCPNGIYRMSPDIEGLVQTSNNLARVLLKDGKYEVLCLTRSSVETEKEDLVNAIKACFKNIGANTGTSGAYPGWQPKPDADIVKLMTELYRSEFNSEPHVMACHAGLECGILGQNYPDMDMISFGPNIRGAHSPDEKVQISSVQKFWRFLLKTLEEIPSRA